ncbi:MAG: hypothetical protein J07HX5_00062 [halophilic archaeon J07HX5]|nr:MAG: hypothetical protein J07HX5_00062 [halophilic archaeon J07HX5]
MRLDEFIEGFERDESATRRRLAREKSYAIADHLEAVEQQFAETVQGESLVGATAPEIFVGQAGHPRVSAGVLAPVADTAETTDPAAFATDGAWYEHGLGISDVLQRRTSLLNATQSTQVEAADAWAGFRGVQREVAIADHPVDVEVDLDGPPEFDLAVSEVATPTGPQARAIDATLTENPHVSAPVKKTLADDDWAAEGAMTYLYRRGFDVYEINTILSAGALGRERERRLVPTRWSITAVDDVLGQYQRGQLQTAPAVDTVTVWHNSYLGNDYWVVLAPGDWEFELVELKAPGSVWNPAPDGEYHLAADSEGATGRSGYVEETAGAYHAARLAVLEALADRGRQASCLVLRHARDGYWAPVGVWQMREAVRHAFTGDPGPATAETFHDAVETLVGELPVSLAALRRKSTLVAGLQSRLGEFSP